MNDFFVHKNGICESSKVGKNTKIWAFAHILPGVSIGEDCNICDGVFIENDVSVGNRVTIKCGVQLWDGITIDDDVFIGPNATFTNDPFPRSKMHRKEPLKTRIRKGASIGANATILPGIEIGAGAMIGAGAVITMNVPPNAVVYGNPGRIMHYTDTGSGERETGGNEAKRTSILESPVNGVVLHDLPNVLDMRGNLSAVEFNDTFPFRPKRYFVVYDVPSEKIRGQHAHRKCSQFLVCVKGSCSVMVDDGKKRAEYQLTTPSKALFVPPMIWCVQYKYTRDAVLLVFASHRYDEKDYIRNYDAWLALLSKNPVKNRKTVK
jgi:acetyltransferase-like isoleucine patch superfamily enzyme/dTDP-4-dehydrorhamnose 3,5-epimerase-like enzyme